MKIKVRVEGGRELEQGLAMLKGLGARQAVRATLKEVSEAILARMLARAPSGEGRLREAIGMRIRVFGGKRQSASMRADIGVRKATAGDYRPTKGGGRQKGSAPAGYGRLQEFGTHDMPAQPFIRPAWDAEGGLRALDKIKANLARQIARIGQRQARATARLRRKGK